MIQQQGTRKKEYVFVLFPSTMLKHLEVHSSNRKTTITRNNFKHCRVSFSSTFRETTLLEAAGVNEMIIL